jgi:hypothetical protein
VILNVDQLDDLQDGEILVAPFTSTSWTPVSRRIAAAVTDARGIMYHAAIVAREYRLPAVLGRNSHQTDRHRRPNPRRRHQRHRHDHQTALTLRARAGRNRDAQMRTHGTSPALTAPLKLGDQRRPARVVVPGAVNETGRRHRVATSGCGARP